jgi:hypothetical protein
VNIAGSSGGTIVGDGNIIVAPAGDGAPAAGSIGSSQASGSATAGADGSTDEGVVSVSVDSSGGPSTVVNGEAPDMPAVDYTNGNKLTWVVNGTRVQILSNLPLAELVKIAGGLVLK